MPQESINLASPKHYEITQEAALLDHAIGVCLGAVLLRVLLGQEAGL